MNQSNKIQVLVADDHKMVTDGLRNLIDSSGTYEVCGVAHNGRQVLSYLDSKKVDLILMDIRMPEINGIDLTVKIKKARKDIKVIILSTYANEGFIHHSLEAGADGYLLKEDGMDKLFVAMDTIIDGHTYLSQKVSDSFIRHIQKPPEKSLVLTHREMEILNLLSQGYTSDEIGDKLSMSKHTVDVFRKNLIGKFNAKNVAELICMAVNDGYLL